MKKLSEFPVLVGLSLLAAISLLALGDRNEHKNGEAELSEMDQIRAELELSFLKFQRDLPKEIREVPLERRKAMEQWHLANEEKFTRRETLKEECKRPSDPS
jgi:hypothetical protein